MAPSNCRVKGGRSDDHIYIHVAFLCFLKLYMGNPIILGKRIVGFGKEVIVLT